RYISADTTRPGDWQDSIPDHDAVINLAGTSIFRRWNEEYKKGIRDSRVLTTRRVVEAIPQDRGCVLCSTSAVGYYGWRQDEELTEEAGAGFSRHRMQGLGG
ncbi:NAD-dependent epimerase/dehydratase family protein, partial [Thermodesulfobacteriota bacterium]